MASGVPMFGAPDIERSFSALHATATAVLFFVPGLVGLVLDPVVFLLADRYPRRWFIRGGLAAQALGTFAAAAAPNLAVLAIAISFWYVAAGASTALTEATLVDRDPDHRARTMARWSLLSLIGDVSGPVLLGALAALGLGWRLGFVIVGAILALSAVAMTLRKFPEELAAASGAAEGAVEGEPPQPGLIAALRDALRDRVLLAWLFGLALCDLLDEILVVFASLRVRGDLGASTTWQSVTIGAFTLGGALGLIGLERLLARRSEQQLLVFVGAACAACYAAWLAAPTVWLSALLIIPVGATATPLYPLVAARAYARRPGQSGSVLAASHLFTPFGLAIPWVLGAVADRAGVLVALALLILQPIGLTVLAVASRQAPPKIGNPE